MAFIEIKNLYYRYPTSDTWMLKGVSLRIGRERVVVTGSTGSGKTTLLRVISGLAVKVYGGDLLGEVRVEGRAVYVPQNFDLYVLMPTAREELTYILANQGLSLAEVEAEIRRLSDLLGIKEVLDQNVMKLSMGQRQRVAIASALSLKPDILLLDEPFAHIDPKGVVELTKILKNIDATVIIAEHKLRYIGDLASRLVLLKDGVIDYDGPLENIPALDPDIEWPLKLLVREGS
ncbi:MAG: ABC transporter ATP-binding protein [Sulfolobales archaeon]